MHSDVSWLMSDVFAISQIVIYIVIQKWEVQLSYLKISKNIFSGSEFSIVAIQLTETWFSQD